MFLVISSFVCPLSRVLPCLLAPSPRALGLPPPPVNFGIVAPPSPSSPPVAATAVRLAVSRRSPSAHPFASPTAGAPPTPSTRAAAAVVHRLVLGWVPLSPSRRPLCVGALRFRRRSP